jgi:hypothetical protein
MTQDVWYSRELKVHKIFSVQQAGNDDTIRAVQEAVK